MKIDTVRKQANALGAVTEKTHHTYSSIRVRGKIVVTIPPDEDFVHAFVNEEDRELALALYPEFLKKLFWGNKVLGRRVALKLAKPSVVKSLVHKAYESRVHRDAGPKMPTARLDGPSFECRAPGEASPLPQRPTRYDRQRKLGLWHSVRFHRLGSRCLPPRAALARTIGRTQDPGTIAQMYAKSDATIKPVLPHSDKWTTMIACYLRYIIDATKLKEFEHYGKLWIPLVEKFGGRHLGYFMPSEGANNVALAIFTFPSFALYEEYRAKSFQDSECQAAFRYAEETMCILSYERSFFRPVLSAA